MRRSWIKRGVKRMRQASRKRRVSGEFTPHLKADLLLRSGGRCEIRAPGCTIKGTDRAHVVPRGSAGGKWILEHVVWACRSCHQLDREEFAKGRLVWDRTDLPIRVGWQIEIRTAKNTPLLDVLGRGSILMALPKSGIDSSMSFG